MSIIALLLISIFGSLIIFSNRCLTLLFLFQLGFSILKSRDNLTVYSVISLPLGDGSILFFL